MLATDGMGDGRPQALLRPQDVAELLNVSTATLSRWRRQGIGPRYHKFHKARTAIIRYAMEAVEEFLGDSQRDSTSEEW